MLFRKYVNLLKIASHSDDQAVMGNGASHFCHFPLGEGDLRLVDSDPSRSGYGRLEIFLQGEWGTVCSDGFRSAEADVACSQLGYPAASRFGTVGLLG